MFKKKQKKRSPLESTPLRSPGQSLFEERQVVLYENFLVWSLFIVLLWTFTLIEVYQWLMELPPKPFISAAISSVITVPLIFFKIIPDWKKARFLKQAIEGEKFIGQFLENLRSKGFYVFHDIISEGFNIDHVIVGPKGIYTVETKTISKPKKGKAEILYDGETVTICGYPPERNPIIQAKAQANWLKEFIRNVTEKSISVRPVVLYPGWFVSRMTQGAEVWVLNHKAFPAFLDKERKTSLSDVDIKAIKRLLEEHNRKPVGDKR